VKRPTEGPNVKDQVVLVAWVLVVWVLVHWCWWAGAERRPSLALSNHPCATLADERTLIILANHFGWLT
jgi:hypothetical protein